MCCVLLVVVWYAMFGARVLLSVVLCLCVACFACSVLRYVRRLLLFLFDCFVVCRLVVACRACVSCVLIDD